MVVADGGVIDPSSRPKNFRATQCQPDLPTIPASYSTSKADSNGAHLHLHILRGGTTFPSPFSLQ